MKPVAVAIIPSNQDRNRSTVPGFGHYNEHGGMHFLAPLIEAECKALGINAQWFRLTPESQDPPDRRFLGLRNGQAMANAWLRSQGGGVRLNLHTDSGTHSHTYAIYGSAKGENESRRLAEAIGPLVHEALATERYEAFERRGGIDFNEYIFYANAEGPACLIELCSHQNERDMRALFAHPDRLAQAVARGLARYLRLPETGELAALRQERDRLRDHNLRLIWRMREASTRLAEATALLKDEA